MFDSDVTSSTEKTQSIESQGFEDITTPQTGTSPEPSASSDNLARIQTIGELADAIKKSFPESFYLLTFIGFIVIMSVGRNKLDLESILLYMSFVMGLTALYGATHYIVRKPQDFFQLRAPSKGVVILATIVFLALALYALVVLLIEHFF